jgi:hypothetical protein
MILMLIMTQESNIARYVNILNIARYVNILNIAKYDNDQESNILISLFINVTLTSLGLLTSLTSLGFKSAN